MCNTTFKLSIGLSDPAYFVLLAVSAVTKNANPSLRVQVGGSWEHGEVFESPPDFPSFSWGHNGMFIVSIVAIIY